MPWRGGSFSWFLGGLVFATIIVDNCVPILSGLAIGGLGAGLGNAWGIRVIRFWKKSRKKRMRIISRVRRTVMFGKARPKKRRRRKVGKEIRFKPEYGC